MKIVSFFSIAIVILCVGCSPDGGILPGQGKPRTIVVRDYNSKHVTSTYTLDEEGRVSTAAYVNKFGSAVVESYGYNGSEGVSRIDRSTNHVANNVQKAETFSFRTIRSADNDIAVKVKTVNGQDRAGAGEEILTRYYYQNGKVVGMTQTDGYGNTVAKGEDE